MLFSSVIVPVAIFLGLIGMIILVIRGRSRNMPQHVSTESVAPSLPPFTPPEPETPNVVGLGASPPDWPSATPFQRVADHMSLLDLSPDGREAMFLHDGDCITVYDAITGTPIKTWRAAAPQKWLKYLGEGFDANCSARRLINTLDDVDSPGIGNEVVLVDLEGGTAMRILAAAESSDAPMTMAISGDGTTAVALSTYSKSHPTFDLDHPKPASIDDWTYSAFGDFKLAQDTLFPETAISFDGRWFAFDQADNDLIVMERWEKPEGYPDLPEDAWPWPNYGEHMTVVCDDGAARLAFAPDQDKLLVLEVDGGLVVADLAATDFRRLKPLEIPDDRPYFGDLVWLRGENQALLAVVKPTPKILLVDLTEGVQLREWPLGSEEAALTARFVQDEKAAVFRTPDLGFARVSLE